MKYVTIEYKGDPFDEDEHNCIELKITFNVPVVFRALSLFSAFSCTCQYNVRLK